MRDSRLETLIRYSPPTQTGLNTVQGWAPPVLCTSSMARPADWVTYCSICASTMPRAQNRAEKGSILHIVKTIPSSYLPVIYLWFVGSCGRSSPAPRFPKKVIYYCYCIMLPKCCYRRHIEVQNQEVDADAEPQAGRGDTGNNDPPEQPEKYDWAMLVSASMGMVDQFKRLLLDLTQLETSVGDIQKYFHMLFSEKMLEKELTFLEDQVLAGKKGWRTRAAESIRFVFTIDKHQRAALAVQGAGQAIHLSQPFPVVQRILSSAGDDVAFRQLPLKQVTVNHTILIRR